MLHFHHHTHTDLCEDAPLRSIESRFDLSATQLQAWRQFEETFCDVRDALEANALLQARDRAPTFEEFLEMQSSGLAVELGGMRRIASAAAQLYRVLSPRQRACADRHLTALCRGLEGIGRDVI